MIEKMNLEDLKVAQKKQALKCMKLLKIHKNAVEEFKNDKLNYSLRGALFWLDDEMKKAVKRAEDIYGIMVYHCILSETEFGVLLDCLYVSKDPDEWEMDIQDIKNGEQIVSFCINFSAPEFSEFGLIGIRPLWGGVLRIW